MTSSSQTRKRGPYARTLVRRREIAAAVLEIVDELGPESVTTALVSARAGIPEATVLYHFATKDDLLVAALDHSEQSDAALAAVDDPGIRLDLQALASAYHEPSTGDPLFRLGRIIRGLAATPGTSAAAFMHRRTRQQVEIFTRLMEQRKRDGLVHPDVDCALLARQVIAMWEGLSVVFADEPEVDTLQLLTDAIRRLSGESWLEFARTVNTAAVNF